MYINDIKFFEQADALGMTGSVISCVRTFFDDNGINRSQKIYACFIKTSMGVLVYPCDKKINDHTNVSLKKGRLFFEYGLMTIDPTTGSRINLNDLNWDSGVYFLDI